MEKDREDEFQALAFQGYSHFRDLFRVLYKNGRGNNAIGMLASVVYECVAIIDVDRRSYVIQDFINTLTKLDKEIYEDYNDALSRLIEITTEDIENMKESHEQA